MEHRVSYTIIGAFVIVLGALLVAALLWLAAGGATGQYKDYLIYLKSGAGSLNSNSPVLYHGVPVGRVSNVTLDPDNPTRARVVLSIKSDAPIKRDTKAEVDTRGVTGAGYISLSGGSPNSPPLQAPAEGELPVIPTQVSSVTSLTTAAQDVAKRIIVVTKRLDAMLSDKNIKSISDSLHNISVLTSNLAQRSKDLDLAISNLNGTLGNARVASKQLPQLIDKAQQTIETFNKVADKIGDAAGGVGKTATHLRMLAPQAQNLIQQLSKTSRSLNQLLDELKRQPNTLLFGKPEPLGPGEHPPQNSGG
jgi:phospholipid/cholesterol/gamma-HCH transport system substrate-binding protein